MLRYCNTSKRSCASRDPQADDDSDGDDADIDSEDLADDVIAALRDAIGPKLVPNGTYTIVLEGVTYTELPLSQGAPYLTYNYRILKGPYAGKRIVHREALVR
jgi:hypothetical protein